MQESIKNRSISLAVGIHQPLHSANTEIQPLALAARSAAAASLFLPDTELDKWVRHLTLGKQRSLTGKYPTQIIILLLKEHLKFFGRCFLNAQVLVQ